MMDQMRFDEGLNEEIAVIVPGVPSHGQGLADLGTSLFKLQWIELLWQELIGESLIDDYFTRSHTASDQLDRIVRAPGLPIRPQIVREGLDAPRAGHRRTYGGER